jgi:benzoyl-CoA reductase/2-hydroxyglutaryl-CoA dehydratase subunit BcrC/BadD/HgdB
MAAENKSEARKKRNTATEAAARIPRMVREMINDELQAKADGKPVAYTFICSAYDEIIRAMDIVPHWVENYAGVCAAKRDAQRFLDRAESENLSRSLCTYALCGIGFDAWREEAGKMPPNAPWGGQVKPDMMLASGQMICDPRNKWFQAAQHYMPDVPVFNMGLPWPPFEENQDHREVFSYYKKYIVEQLNGLVAFLEKQTRSKMDWQRLNDLVDLTDRTWNLIWEAYELRRAVPTPMDTGDAMNTMVPINFMMATQKAFDFFTDLKNELQQKIAVGEGVVPLEKYRLLWGGGLPSWFALTDFNYFNSKGAVFPAETTYRTVEAIYNFSQDLTKIHDPLEHIACRWLNYWTFWYDLARQRHGSHPDVERLIRYIEDYQIDGVVMHEAYSCRSWHVGLISQLKTLKKVYRDIPSLVLESDIVDINSYSEADTHSRIDAFIETLDSGKRC